MEANYASDLSDEQWPAISRLIPSVKPGGRPRTVNMQNVLDGLFLFGENRLRLADVAQGLSAEGHGVFLFQDLSPGWNVGTNS